MDLKTIEAKKQALANKHNEMKRHLAVMDAETADRVVVRENIIASINQTKGAFDTLTEIEQELQEEEVETK